MPGVTDPFPATRATATDGVRRAPRVVWLVLAIAVVVIGGSLIAVGAGVIANGGSAMDPPRFIDETTASGVAQKYLGDFDYYVGGGVAVLDCNDDGRPDLYLAGGSGQAALYRNESTVGGPLRFQVVPATTTDMDAVTGAYPIDIDGDGKTDLAVLRNGENVLLRGLGDCRFERANEAWHFDGGDGWTTAFSATWEQGATLPTLAVGDYLQRPAAADGIERCAGNVLIRPASTGNGYGPPVPLSPSWCDLSMLFSDWSHSGQTDLRISNDRHYYRDNSGGEEQLWQILPGQPPRLYTEADGWKPVKIWGMGIASQDLNGDGRPEIFLTSQNDNKLQTLSSGATGPTYQDIALRDGVTANRPFVGDTTLGSTGWHPEFEDVNNDTYMDLYISKGNVEAMPDFAARDPSNLFLGQADGSFVEVAQQAGIVDFERGRGAALVDLNMDGMVDLVEVKRMSDVKLWRDVGWGDAAAPAAMGGWIGLRLVQPGPNRDAIGSWIQVKTGDRVVVREVTIGGGHAGGQLGWIHFGLGPASTAQVRVQWPDGSFGPWQDIAANEYAIVSRDPAVDRALGPATVSATRRTASQAVHLAEVELPEFGLPEIRPELPTATYAARVEALRARAEERGYDHLLVYADREHSANLSFLSGFDPRFEEALLVLGWTGRPGLLVGNECWGMADAAPLPMERYRFQDFSLPGQPRDRSRPLQEILGDQGIERGSRVGVIGWKTYATRATMEAPAFIVDALRELVGGTGLVENAGDLMIDAADGLRVINDVDQLAAFEFASCQTSSGVSRLLRDLRPGMRESEAVRWLGWDGTPLSCHLMLTAGPRAALGLLSPGDRVIERGDPFTVAFGIWGALTCRAGFVVEEAAEMPPPIRDYVDRLVGPYFSAVADWYEALHIGQTGGALQAIIDRHLGDPFFGIFLNPGHQLHLDEWVNSPVGPGSAIELRSGMALQVDIIPATGTPYFTTNIEDGIALADETLRALLAVRYPGAWARIEARRRFMAKVLGIELHPDVLPFSNIPACLPPFLLRPNLVVTLA